LYVAIGSIVAIALQIKESLYIITTKKPDFGLIYDKINLENPYLLGKAKEMTYIKKLSKKGRYILIVQPNFFQILCRFLIKSL